MPRLVRRGNPCRLQNADHLLLIDDDEFLPIVSVNVGDQRQKGWVHFPRAEGLRAAIPAQAQAYAC